MFNRKIENTLNSYYKDKNAKIIIIDGARQIGKTFIKQSARRLPSSISGRWIAI